MADQPPPPPPKKKSSCGCCLLKIFLALFVIGAIGAGIAGWYVYSTYRWFATIPQPTPMVFEPLNISPGEQQDVERVLNELHTAEVNRATIDESITPNVFNGVVQAILDYDKAHGKNDDLVGLRGGFDGPHMKLDASWKANAAEYYNISTTFDAEIVDGEAKTLDLVKMQAAGKDVSALMCKFLAWIFQSSTQSANKPQTDPKAREMVNGLKKFKLVRKEGERLHIILDYSKVPPDTTLPAGETVDTKEPKKEEVEKKDDADKKDADK